jgi:2-phosphosulfolactate phosphatase
MYFRQAEFDIRCEWGYQGVIQLAPQSDAVVIIDVMSFCTCVDIAVNNGAIVYPFQWKDETALAYAQSEGAVLASVDRSSENEYTLSPTSLLRIAPGTRLVLPSPNGATLSLATGPVPTFAGCLRNAEAVARAVERVGKRIALIPAGERWADGSLRPAIEDWVGAGAIASYLPGVRSPEAQMAEDSFLAVRANLTACLEHCSSSKELIGRGFASDVALAMAFNVSHAAPMLVDRAFRSSDLPLP